MQIHICIHLRKGEKNINGPTSMKGPELFTLLYLYGKNKLASIHQIPCFDNDMMCCVISLVTKRGASLLSR